MNAIAETPDHRGAGAPRGTGERIALRCWAHFAAGDRHAALEVDAPNAFINEAAIGPDRVAYLANSNAPSIFRVIERSSSWQVETWFDATETTTQEPGFNLGSIVVSPDRQVASLRRVGPMAHAATTSRPHDNRQTTGE